jgi:O-antigen ligase
MIRDHWFFGIGLGRFWDYFERYEVTNYYTRYPHNFLLEIFAELGIVGGCALIGFLIASVSRPLRASLRLFATGERDRAVTSMVPLVACALLLVHALVDIDWHAPANPILLFLILALTQPTPGSC